MTRVRGTLPLSDTIQNRPLLLSELLTEPGCAWLLSESQTRSTLRVVECNLESLWTLGGAPFRGSDLVAAHCSPGEPKVSLSWHNNLQGHKTIGFSYQFHPDLNCVCVPQQFCSRLSGNACSAQKFSGYTRGLPNHPDL